MKTANLIPQALASLLLLLPLPLSLCVAVLAPSLALAQAGDDPPLNILDRVGIDQQLDEQVPPDLAFHDETGATVHLGDYFNSQRPVILVLAYYRCPMLCTEVLNGLVDSLQKINLDMGRQYRVVTVSFDPKDSPELAAQKKATYAKSYDRAGTEDGWHFLTGDQEAIQQLARAVGFRYVYDAATDQYAHGSGIMVLTPQGKLSRVLFRHRVSGARSAAGAGRIFGGKNRHAGRSTTAVVLPLRSGDGQIYGFGHVAGAVGRRCDHVGVVFVHRRGWYRDWKTGRKQMAATK